MTSSGIETHDLPAVIIPLHIAMCPENITESGLKVDDYSMEVVLQAK
jgi:hypothetical protein